MTDFFKDEGSNKSTDDPVRDAMARANLGIRPNYLPLGSGIFEYDRVAWGASPKSGAERMTIRLVCVSHDKAEHVGKAFIHSIDYVGKGQRTLSMVLADFTKFLILPFGPDAAKAMQSDKVKDLIVAAYKEKFATIVNEQGLRLGGNVSPFKGRRIKLDCVQGGEVKNKPGQYHTNVFPDAVETPAAA